MRKTVTGRNRKQQGYKLSNDLEKQPLKCAVIGASSDSVYAIETAKAMGVYVYAVDGNPEAEGLKVANAGIVCDISDIQKTEKAVKEIKPDFLLPVPVGRYNYTSACINEAFGLKGIKKNFTEISVDKFKFHRFLNERGLRRGKMYLLKPYEENIKKNYNIKFPNIIKPRFGSGSRNVFYNQNLEELDGNLDKVSYLKEDFLLEEAAVGTEYAVSAVKISKKLTAPFVIKKIMTPLPKRQAVAYLSVSDNDKTKEMIISRLNDICGAMGYDDCFIQADLIVNSREVFVIEMSPRPMGHYIYDVFAPFATGVNTIKEYINYMTLRKDGCKSNPTNTKKAAIKYFDFENMTVSYVPEEEEVRKSVDCKLIKWKCNIQKGDYMGKVTDGHSIMGRGYFILEGENDEKLMADSDRILGLFR